MVESAWELDLDLIADRVWRVLEEGVSSARHGFHQPILISVDGSGVPEGRMVVLRGVDASERCVWCHTDARSPKVASLGSNANGAWVFYDKPGKVQVRAWGATDVLRSGEAWERAWAGSRLSSRRCYLAPRSPGTVVSEPDVNLPAGMEGRVPSEAESKAGRANFAVVRTRIDRMDWLWLNHDGHVRASFVWDDAGALTAHWVAV